MNEDSILQATLNQTPVLVFRMDEKGNLISLVGSEVGKLGLDASMIGKSQFKNPNFPYKPNKSQLILYHLLIKKLSN